MECAVANQVALAAWLASFSDEGDATIERFADFATLRFICDDFNGDSEDLEDFDAVRHFVETAHPVRSPGNLVVISTVRTSRFYGVIRTGSLDARAQDAAVNWEDAKAGSPNAVAHVTALALAAIVQAGNERSAEYVKGILQLTPSVQQSLRDILCAFSEADEEEDDENEENEEAEKPGGAVASGTTTASPAAAAAAGISPQVAVRSTTRSPRSGRSRAFLEREVDWLRSELDSTRAELESRTRALEAAAKSSATAASFSALAASSSSSSSSSAWGSGGVDFDSLESHLARVADLEKELDSARASSRELSERVARLTPLQDEVLALRDELDVLRPAAEARARAEATVERLKARLEAATGVKEQVKRLESQNESLSQRVVELESETSKIPALKRQLETYKASKTEAEVRSSELQMSLEEARAQADEFKAALAAMREGQAALAAARRVADDDHDDGALGRPAVGGFGDQLGVGDGINEFNPEVVERLARLEMENKQLRAARNGEASERLEALESLLDDTRRLKESFEERYRAASARGEGLEKSLTAARETVQTLTTELDALRSDAAQLRSQLSETSARLADSSALAASLETQLRKVQDDLAVERAAHAQSRTSAAAAAADLEVRHEAALAAAARAQQEASASARRVLEESMAAAEAERTRLLSRHDALVADLQSTHASTVAKLKAAHDEALLQKQSENLALLQSASQERLRLVEEHASALSTQRTEFESQRAVLVAEHAAALARAHDALEQTRTTASAERERLASEHTSAVAALHAAHEAALRDLCDEMEEAKKVAAQERDELLAAHATAIACAAEERAKLEAALETASQVLTAARAQAAAELADAEALHAAAIAATEAGHARALADLEASHEAHVQRLSAEAEAAAASAAEREAALVAAHDAAQASLRALHATATAEAAAAHAADVAQLRAAHEAELAQGLAELAHVRESGTQALAVLRAEFDAFRAGHATTNEQHEAEMATFAAQLADQTGKTEAALSQLAATEAKLSAECAALAARNADIVALQQTLESRAAEIASHLEELDEKDLKLRTMHDEAARADAVLSRTKRRVMELEDELRRVRAENGSRSGVDDEKDRQLERLAEVNKNLLAQKNELQAKLQALGGTTRRTAGGATAATDEEAPSAPVGDGRPMTRRQRALAERKGGDGSIPPAEGAHDLPEAPAGGAKRARRVPLDEEGDEEDVVSSSIGSGGISSSSSSGGSGGGGSSGGVSGAGASFLMEDGYVESLRRLQEDVEREREKAQAAMLRETQAMRKKHEAETSVARILQEKERIESELNRAQLDRERAFRVLEAHGLECPGVSLSASSTSSASATASSLAAPLASARAARSALGTTARSALGVGASASVDGEPSLGGGWGAPEATTDETDEDFVQARSVFASSASATMVGSVGASGTTGLGARGSLAVNTATPVPRTTTLAAGAGGVRRPSIYAAKTSVRPASSVAKLSAPSTASKQGL